MKFCFLNRSFKTEFSGHTTGADLSEESSAGSEELPGQAGVPLVVVLEGLVQLAAPVDGVDDLGFAVVDVGWHVHRAVGDVDGDAGEVLVGGEDHAGVAGPEEVVRPVPVLGEVALVLRPRAVVVLVEHVELLGVVVGVSSLLQPLTALIVVLVVQGNVLRELHDPLDGVDLVLHHDLHLDGHLPHHRQTVNFLHSDLVAVVVALKRER